MQSTVFGVQPITEVDLARCRDTREEQEFRKRFHVSHPASIDPLDPLEASACRTVIAAGQSKPFSPRRVHRTTPAPRRAMEFWIPMTFSALVAADRLDVEGAAADAIVVSLRAARAGNVPDRGAIGGCSGQQRDERQLVRTTDYHSRPHQVGSVLPFGRGSIRELVSA